MWSFYRFDHLLRENYLTHAVSQKETGEAHFFSLALHTGEDAGEIVANRRNLARQLSVDEASVFISASQTHSSHVRIIDNREMQGWERLEDAVEDCDALVTDRVNVILTILTADCVPILLYDPIKRVVAAVHAGWRGTEGEIAIKTIDAMKHRFGTNPSDILAGVAPAIGKCCYEVGEDVASHFFDYRDAMEQYRGKYMLDLPEINKRQMISSGVREEHIEMSGICTACEVDRYFSYRREQGCSGRFMSVIGTRSQYD